MNDDPNTNGLIQDPTPSEQNPELPVKQGCMALLAVAAVPFCVMAFLCLAPVWMLIGTALLILLLIAVIGLD